MSRFGVMAVAGLAVLAAGCAATKTPYLTIEYHPGQKPETFQSPYPATYELFVLGPLPTEPIDKAEVQEDYHVGFVREPDGSLVAYAGGRKISLPEGSYRWAITPATRRNEAGMALDAGGNVLVWAAAVPVAVGGFVLELAPQILYALAKAGGGNGQ